MGTLEKRLDHLEAMADPPALPPLILYVHLTAARCAEMNAQRNPVNNPLFMEVRPVVEVQNGNG